jgi:hypothetical protein
MKFAATFRYLFIATFILNFLIGCSGSSSDNSGTQQLAPGDTDNANTIRFSDASYTISPTSGVASLNVDFSAEQSSAVSSYHWDFGDGNVATGPSVTHVYSTAGSYTVVLTITDTLGNEYTSERTVNVFSSVDNSSVIVPNGVTFYDDFDYIVNREGDTGTVFMDNGWSGYKAENLTGSHAGYLYTVDQIPGYSGPFPGRNSTQVLAIENASATFNSQSDFYLQYGNPDVANEQIPGNVWFQFWLYPNYYDDPNDQNDQLSGFDVGFKFIYPTNDPYPSQTEKWIWSPGAASAEPYWDMIGDDINPSRDLYSRLGGTHSSKNYAYAESYNAWKLGHTDLSERIVHNRWTLVKIHIDTSQSPGSYEMWLKPLGGEWVKVVEWIEGITDGFTWPISADQLGGHRAFRMPTTVNPNFNWWIYMDDFAMATSEEALPIYPY